MMIEEKRGFKCVTINPDAADFNIKRVINKVYMQIKQSTKKSTKKLLNDNLLRELLEATVGFKWKCKKDGPKLVKKVFKNVARI